MLRELERLLKDAGNLSEVLILSVLLFGLLSFLRGTRGEGMLKSLGFFLAVGFIVLRGLSQEFELARLTLVLDAIFQASVIALVVIFQPELRRGLALKIGDKWFQSNVPEQQVLEEVATAAARLSKSKEGALMAIERKDGLKNYITTGTVLDAQVKADLLANIFWPGAPLHDGAVIIQNGRIAAAGCFLPLTDNPDISKALGTRHRAAIGLSEVEDALVVVVSEETGTISLAEGGRLHRELDRESLLTMLKELYLTPEDDDEPPGVGADLPPLPGDPTGTSTTLGPGGGGGGGKTTTRHQRRIVGT
ncbi:MAG: diadenylate cyclase CdaA [Planctomycetes bacterium]|nr:diadenylate cyclase CdaA [Planctomycetota bacterium]